MSAFPAAGGRHDTQDHPEDRFHANRQRRQFTCELDTRQALKALVNSCLNWSMQPTRLECGPRQIHHSVEYRDGSRLFGRGIEPKWELVTFTGPQAMMLPLLKLAAHQKVLMDNAAHTPDAPMPPLVLARILDIPLDSFEFQKVKEACRANHLDGPSKQQTVVKDLAAHFASMLIGEQEPATRTQARADTALGLAS